MARAVHPEIRQRALAAAAQSWKLFQLGEVLRGREGDLDAGLTTHLAAVRQLLESVAALEPSPGDAPLPLDKAATRANQRWGLFAYPLPAKWPALIRLVNATARDEPPDPVDLETYDEIRHRFADVCADLNRFLHDPTPTDRGTVWKWLAAVLLLAFGGGLLAYRATHRPAVAGGHGLVGTYFGRDASRTPITFSRLDSQIDFDWSDTAPHPEFSNDDFAVRWEGRLLVPKTGRYTFDIECDDDARLFLDHQLVLDLWRPGVRERKKAVCLQRGAVDLRMDFRERSGFARIKLLWAGDNFDLTPVAPYSLLPPRDPRATSAAADTGRVIDCP